jgi:hypothetical protein
VKLPVIATTLIVALLLGCQHPQAQAPQPTVIPGTDSPTPSIPTIPLSGKSIASIGGEVSHPALSPDGQTLAYSAVVVQNKAKLVAIHLYDLKTHRRSTLLTPEQSKKYKSFSCFVTQLTWYKADRLEAHISDGDVDSSHLIFNPKIGKLISDNGEAVAFRTLSPEQQILYQKVLAAQPNLASELVKNSLMSSRYVETDRGLIFKGPFGEKNGSKEPEHRIWFLDYGQRSLTPLFPANSPFNNRDIAGGVTVDGRDLFLLSNIENAGWFSHHQGVVKPLSGFDGPNGYSSFKVLYRSPQRGIIETTVNASYKSETRNRLFQIGQGQVTEILSDPDFISAAVNAQGTRIAYDYLVKGKHQITVKDLPPDKS